MIGYIEGKLLKMEQDRILLLNNQIGYEILLPAFVGQSLRSKKIGDDVALHIYFHQTERQPKPVLIGFNLEAERDFFRLFISVEDIGPMKAVKALTLPIRDIARAIESRDLACLKQLKGVGNRTAQKILATLEGKAAKFALISQAEESAEAVSLDDFMERVQEVLTKQLGHKTNEARKMIAAALKRNKNIATAEELFEEVYRGEAS
ncbi:MAG: ATP-dependent DNA helicase RuvA [Desulfobacterales bacterium C00003060]|nr:MAG: ATP-dependent DNA helicase RuvA [Desulfobacterales bacterium S3730MH5]OEU77529.1 MAG: ATP-dependent DNA helicase RuvA [Desulfobacterales bacterium C00003060]OEU78918.1 MAG: ATP-dependent DNA helicase RuvA [Desulfobacterales bacterium S5133MH4]